MTKLIRQYVDCSMGQLHIRIAGDKQSGKVPLICFHMSPYSSLCYENFAPEMAADRLVVCPDTPGYGGSDAFDGSATMEGYASAMVEMLDVLDLETVDLMGFHTGSFVAAAVAHIVPDRVRKLVLPGIPYVAAEDRAARLEMFSKTRPYFTEGGYIQKRWDMGLKAQGKQSNDQFLALFAESLRPGAVGMNRGFAAVFKFDPDAVLPSLPQPVLIPVPDEMLAQSSRAAAPLFQNAMLQEWPDLNGDLFDADAKIVAARMREWLDA